MGRRRGARQRLLLAAALGVLWLAVAAPRAGAHALLRSADPAAGASLAQPPREVVLAFTEAPDPALSSIRVLDANGRAVDSGRAGVVPGRPLALRAPVGRLADGTYTVSWRVVSRIDGHVTRGSFGFGVGAGSGGGAAPTGSPAATPASPAPSALALAGRWALFWGLALLLGAAASGLLVWRGPLPGPARPLLGAGLGLAVAGLGAVVGAERSAVGVPLGALLAAAPGRALAREAVALGLVAAATGALLARPRSRAALAAVGLATMVALGAHAAGGHAGGQSSLRAANLLVQWVHLAAVAAWTGGLAWLLVGLRGRDRGELVTAVARFSRLALAAVALVAATGLARAAGEVGSPSRLLATGFGRALLAKAALVAVLVALAAANRYRHLPALTSGDGSLATLRRTVRGELAVAVVVVLAAALLAELPPAAFATAPATTPPPPPAAVTVSGSDYATTVRLTLTVTPGLAGPNTFTARLADYDTNTPLQASRVELEFGLPAHPDLGDSTLELRRVADGLWRGQGSALSLRGRWQVTALVVAAGRAASVPLQVPTRTPPELLTPARTSGPPPPDPPDALVLGGRAGSALVGLTAYARDGLLVARVRGGIGIPPPLAPTTLRLSPAHGRALTLLATRRCGVGCGEALLGVPPAGRYTVQAAFPGGVARFALPVPLPAPAAERLRAADRTLAAAGSYRLHEVLDSGRGAVFESDYAFKAPDQARWRTTAGGERADTVWVGEARYTRHDDGPWKKESVPGLTLPFPARNWSDQEANVTDLGPGTLHGTPVRVLAFLDAGNGAYHRLWVDPAGRILRERMDAPGHFMTRDYHDYGTALTITSPR
jgi:copper transport protein